MKTKGIIFTYDEIEELNENGYLTDYQLLDDNGGDPYGNCVIVLKDQFREGEIDEEIRNSILVELPDNPYVEGATKSVETENYRFTFSRYADNPWYCEVIEK